MTFEVTGFGEFADDLEDWADEFDDVDPVSAREGAAYRLVKKLHDLIQKNIDEIPHNLTALRESWRFFAEGPGKRGVFTNKDYAHAFEYGHTPYDINPAGFMNFDPETDWDNWNPEAKSNDKYMLDDGTWLIGKVEHPGFYNWRYVAKAIIGLQAAHAEDILEEHFIDKELRKAF